MGDATRGSPVPLQASIIPSLGSNHKPLYVKKLSLAAHLPALLALLGTIISSSLSRAPLTPLRGRATRLFSCSTHPDALTLLARARYSLAKRVSRGCDATPVCGCVHK